MTNKLKLVSWDADYYSTLSDDICIICLSEKQRYLLGETIRQIEWGTRWIGDTSGLDLDAIAGELEFRIADMDNCQTIGEIYDMLQGLGTKIIDIQTQISIINNNTGGTGTTIPSVLSPIENNIPSSTLDSPIGNFENPCTTDEEKTEMYSGVVALAEYWVQNVTDFLEIVEQNVANPAEIAENMIEAIPLFGLLPVDDAIEYAGWLVENLLDAWNAGITTTFMRTLECDLFCLAVANGCKLTGRDLIEFCNAQIGEDLFLIALRSVADAITFLVGGTYSGTQMIYAQLGLAIIIAEMGERWLGALSLKSYEIEFLAGKNDGNTDWQTFCDECDPWIRVIEHDFATQGLGDWILDDGTIESVGILGEDIGTRFSALARIVLPQQVSVIGARMTYSMHGAIGNGTFDVAEIRGYSDDSFVTQTFFAGGGFQTDGTDKVLCDEENSTVQSIRIWASVGEHPSTSDHEVSIAKIEVFTDAASGLGKVRKDVEICP